VSARDHPSRARLLSLVTSVGGECRGALHDAYRHAARVQRMRDDPAIAAVVPGTRRDDDTAVDLVGEAAHYLFGGCHTRTLHQSA
jgi:hypothetical protein